MTTEQASLTEPEIRHGLTRTKLGVVYLATNGHALTGAWLDGQAHFATAAELGEETELASEPILSQAAQELEEYLDGKRTTFGVPLAPQGTDFQLAVWEALKEIPYGYTTTYGAISKIVGPHAPAQAVGQAVGRNRCLIFIPCHRVISADGNITGYAAGVETKQWLLNLEEPADSKAEKLF